MRLVCPNCGAQYEVSDEAIPGGGRDVQCSACGHTWFQAPAGTAAPHAAAPYAASPDETVLDDPDGPDGPDGPDWPDWNEGPVAEDDDEEADDLAEIEAAPRGRGFRLGFGGCS